MATIINITPHPLNIKVGEETLTIPPSGVIARLSVTHESQPSINIDGVEVPVYKTKFGPIENLPKPQKGFYYVASALVANAANRSDVLSPGELIRDNQGNVIGAKGLTAYK